MRQLFTTLLILFTSFSFSQTNTFPADGNVGIGTTSPSSTLHIESTNDAIITLKTTDNQWLYTNWLDQNNIRKLWMGFNTDLSAFNISLQNGANKILLNGGNVGIGTSSPLAKLHVEGDGIRATRFSLSNVNDRVNDSPWYGLGRGTYTDLSNDDDKVAVQLSGYYGLLLQTASGKVGIHQNGNVGIGTTAPISKLSIYISGDNASYPTINQRGDVFFDSRSFNNGIEFGNSKGFNDRKSWILARHSSVDTYGYYYSSLHLQPDVGNKSQYRGVAIGYNASNQIPVGTHLAVEGNVGIGTTNPDSKLTVKGKIHAEEVKIDLSVPAPDYVFTKDYDLLSIEEVQQHITEKGHLPNIPSAKEMESNGVELGIMNMKLLEKIEELTLYTIKQEKELKAQQKEIELLKQQNTKIEALEAKLELLLSKQ